MDRSLPRSRATTKGKVPFHPGDVGAEIWGHITNPFYDAGPNDKGVGIQLAIRLSVLTGFGLAAHRHPIGVSDWDELTRGPRDESIYSAIETSVTAGVDAACALHHQRQ